MAIEPGVYKTPYQKIFTDQKDLNLFLLKLVKLMSNKKINIAKKDIPIDNSYKKYIRVYTKEDALRDPVFINPIEGSNIEKEKIILESTPSVKLQTTKTADFLKNYFNIRILLGFDTRANSQPITIARDLFSGSDTSKIFIFCYLQIFRYKSTWRTVITRGNYGNSIADENNQFKYNIIAQDILADYFQTGLYKSYITNKKKYG